MSSLLPTFEDDVSRSIDDEGFCFVFVFVRFVWTTTIQRERQRDRESEKVDRDSLT